MRSFLVYCYVLLFGFGLNCQTNCETAFVGDTLTFPSDGKVYNGKYVETTLKNFSVVRLFIADNNRLFLKMIVTKNFYFDKVATLEIRSGHKSYYAKDTKQYKITKTSGLFVIEVFKNYVATIREEGITSIVFGEAETDFTRQDAKQIKQIAKCVYEAISGKK